MTSRIPEKPSEHEAEGLPDPGYDTEPAHDTPLAADDFGTTAGELHDGEPLDGRLAREEPDVLSQADRPADESDGADTPHGEGTGQGVGRLVEPDEGARSDTEADLVAQDVGTDLGGYTAEEAAMHVEPEA